MKKDFWLANGSFRTFCLGQTLKNLDYLNHFDAHIDDVCQSIDRPREFLIDVKTKMVPEFLQWALGTGAWDQYDVIGFSSTFNQNLASVTLAKLIKEKYPTVKIMFGGANFESEMGLEYFRVFPWIDFVVPGEAEGVLIPLMKSLEKNEPIPNGVVHRSNGGIVFSENHELHEDFSDNAPPDYDDFFEQLRQIDPDSSLLENPVILYETARGCWWGEKHHCTFCGLNATTMKFRSKPTDQVHADISYLSQRYDSFRFRLVDNILEMKYIEGIFGEMARNNFDLQFFLEVKSNLTKQQIKSLARGGANVIQPGIESFSLNQLMEMDKGVRPLQNILCMKWAMYYGVEVNWNILIGFPGETNEDYHQQIQLIKLLFHLPPPECVGDLWLERFSPYYTRPEEYGVTITGPGEAYSYVYDSEEIDLFRIAYDFEFTTKNEVDPRLKKELFDTAEDWKRRHQSDELPYLIFTKSMNFVTVYDERSVGNPNKNRFEGPSAWIIVFCNESPKTIDQIKKHVQELGAQEGAAEKGVLQLEKMGILYGEKGKYLTLALPHNANL